MSAKKPYNPILYGMKLDRTENYAANHGVLFHWKGTHWDTMPDEDMERDALMWGVSEFLCKRGIGFTARGHARRTGW